MKNQQLLSALNTTDEVREKNPKLAILPIGATEQHSSHLPLATDSIVIERMAEDVARKLGAYCLPVLPYSISHMHRGQIGTVWLRNETVQMLIRDIALSLRHDGFKQLILLNGHGGNFILVPIVQDLNLEFPDFLTATCTPPDWIDASGVFPKDGNWHHADEYETAVMLHVRPELVRTGKLRDQAVEPDREMLRYAPFQDYSKLTFTGKPTTATAEQGKRVYEFIIEQTAKSIAATVKKGARRRTAKKFPH